MKKTLIYFYVITVIATFLYSYTQLDLSLTFSRIDFLRQIVNTFQYIGYFNRPLSAFIYILLLVLLLNLYLGFLVMVYAKQIAAKTVWRLILFTAVALVFSYNAYSYDLFNYIFDAKIITHYAQNPYLYKALDFPGDPMLSFMHWTHRVYPYGPVWLVLTVPLSFLGFNLFIPTFFLFKLLMASSYLGTAYYIGKILQKISPKYHLWGITFFALNPLVIFESLISAHIDIVMLFFAVWSLYQLINKKYLFAFILLAISIGIKFVTAGLLPVYLVIAYLQIKNKKTNWNLLFFLSTIIMVATVIYSSQRTNFQPWYLLEVLFIASLISNKYYISIPLIIVSFFSLINYLPYLYLGNWDPPVPDILNIIQITSFVISFIVLAVFSLARKKIK